MSDCPSSFGGSLEDRFRAVGFTKLLRVTITCKSFHQGKNIIDASSNEMEVIRSYENIFILYIHANLTLNRENIFPLITAFNIFIFVIVMQKCFTVWEIQNYHSFH